MTERRLYDILMDKFPGYKDHVSNYGHSSDGHEVRVTLDNHDILIFEYYSEDDWHLCTMKNHFRAQGWLEKIEDLKKQLKEAKKNGK